MKAKISEIFESVQGEGLYTGERQIFVRFYGCNLRCSFCDTPLVSYREHSAQSLCREVAAFDGYHSLSLTGGEPLLQADFLATFLALMRCQRRTKIYLETNGTLWEEFFRIAGDVDIVAMDFKLPSSGADRAYWPEHDAFLKTALRLDKDIFVKMVIASSTKEDDVIKAAALLDAHRGRVPVVLQPSWQDMGDTLTEKMQAFKLLLQERGRCSAHIMSQAHKLAGIK